MKLPSILRRKYIGGFEPAAKYFKQNGKCISNSSYPRKGSFSTIVAAVIFLPFCAMTIRQAGEILHYSDFTVVWLDLYKNLPVNHEVSVINFR
jgi:hypothetical protein